EALGRPASSSRRSCRAETVIRFSAGIPHPVSPPHAGGVTVTATKFSAGGQAHGSGSPAHPSGTAAAARPLAGPMARPVPARARRLPRLGLLAGMAAAGARPADDLLHAERPQTPAVDR